ncbi:MAG: ATP-binding cassette domain-containing protein [Bacteroidia bacterium]|nr:ATP-binding cassette domain-containing protein [Bacteroidia bacterium]
MIKIENISKHFGQQPVLENISMEIPTGSKLCIVGSSGAGKSVLSRLIMGLEKPDSGEIYIDNEPISGFNQQDWRRILDEFGVVFQGAALFDSLTVLENVGLKLFENREGSKRQITERVEEALLQVNLETEILQKYPGQLSGGMRKRVGIARAIIHDPVYLVYDEPTTGLDPISADTIDALIENLAKKPGRTSIIITHDMATVKNLATQVAMIYRNELLFEGSPAAFLASEAPPVRAFLARG